MTKERKAVIDLDKWNVGALYSTDQEWEKEFQAFCPEMKSPLWPKLAAYKGHLGDSAESVKGAITTLLDIDRHLTKLYTYARLRHDEDITNNQNKQAYERISAIAHEFHQEVSWFEPELLALPQKKIQEYLTSPVLADYKFHLEKLLRVKPHTLSAEQEELLAMSGRALQASHKAFSAINDADFKFGTVLDEKGQEKDLTHATFGLYLRDQDRTLRKNAFLKMHGTFLGYENTIGELLNGQVQAHLFHAKARKYETCLDASLFPKNIDTSVCRALIQAVREEISGLHQYVKLRERMLNIQPLHLYDMYVPLTADVDIKMSYDEAEDVVIESVAPLGEEYQKILRKGFKEDRWVDRYENKGKRSGAYSGGCYDSMPYILMNYKGVLRDVFTLAHEAGHSMHSYMSHKNQPYQYGDYPIFLAEVASTFNEELLMRSLLKRFTSKEERIFLLTQKIEDIRTTLFRQTMFAEFELLIHEMAEKNIPLTPTLLKEEFRKMNRFYFGDSVVIDPEAEIEWARIPHFYYNFYVYQYATGISAALALADRVLSGGKKEQEDYLGFLKAGSSKYPIEILQKAGVDMRSPLPVKAAIKRFKTLVQELSKELGK